MKKFTAILASFAVSIAYGQDTLKLSLPDAIQYSLANNKPIQAGLLNSQLNGYRSKEVNSALYPNISANAGVTHYFNVPTQYVAANTLSPSAPADHYVGLKLLLPNSFAIGVSANWTIYDQAVYSARKIISAQSQMSDIQFQKDRTELAFTVGQLYYGIVSLQKQQENLVRVAVNTDKLLYILQTNYDNGLIKRSDLEKAQVGKVNINSQITGLNAAIEEQNKLLKLMMGVPATTVIQLPGLDLGNSLIPLPDSIPGVEKTVDFQLLQTQITLSRLERRLFLSSYVPSAGLVYSYSYNTVHPELNKVINGSYTYPQQFIGVNLSVPIFEGNRTLYRLKQNAVRSRQLELQSEFLAEKINTDIANSLLRYNTSLKNTSSNEANVRLAQKLYGQNVLEYRQGIISLNEVLTTENTLNQALTEYFNSVTTALLALLDYRKATNTILNK